MEAFLLFKRLEAQREKKKKKSRSKWVYGANWVLTTFLDCCCSKLPHKRHVAGWYISVNTYRSANRAGSSVPQRRSLGGAHFSFYHGAMSNYSCTDRSVSAVGEEKGLL